MPSGYVGLPCVRRRRGEDGEGNTFGSPTFLASDDASVENMYYQTGVHV